MMENQNNLSNYQIINQTRIEKKEKEKISEKISKVYKPTCVQVTKKGNKKIIQSKLINYDW